jgi:hypothetical protein
MLKSNDKATVLEMNFDERFVLVFGCLLTLFSLWLTVSHIRRAKLTAEAPATILDFRMRSSRTYSRPGSYAAFAFSYRFRYFGVTIGLCKQEKQNTN